MYESIIEAIKAADTKARQLRDTTVTALTNGGEQAARLAITREHWERPVLTVFADAAQKEPWLLHLPA